MACVATIDLSKAPAPVELAKKGLIDDLEVVPEPGTERRTRRRGAAKDAKPDNGSNGRGRGKK